MLLDLTAASLDYFEQLAALLRAPVLYGREVPRGDGAPVLLVPGYFAGDLAMLPMSRWLKRIGYQPYPSGIDLNLGCPRDRVEQLGRRTAGIARESGRRVAIIGHSLGGVLARAVGRQRPAVVSRVIGLGTPIDHEWDSLHRRVAPIMRSLAGVWQTLAGAPADCGTASCACGFARSLAPGPIRAGVFSSIYTRQDDVVDWRACRDPQGGNHEVRGRHLGLPVNREVYRLLAALLAGRAGLGALDATTELVA
ncbi:MAG TPA: hypothetical protein VND20_11235 [Candidatus Binataceae bacterium]|nr:hypothetical protein [Candidatus Binataceae bacterium]